MNTMSRPALLILGVGVFGVVAALMLATADDYGLTWDEGDHILRIEAIHQWMFGDVPDRWSAAQIEAHWKFAREEPHGHPPFYALLGYAGWLGFRAITGQDGASLGAYRFGPCLAFAATAALAAVLVAGQYGRLAGLAAAAACVLTPRLFGHGHFMNTDCPLVFMWTLTATLFWAAGRSRVCRVLFGLSLGLCAMTKLTGWFVAAPLAAWTAAGAIGRRPVRPWLETWLAAVVLAPLAVWAATPNFWHDPVGGLGRFLESNLSRQATIPVGCYYLGRFYPFSLPWHNTLVLTAATMPLGLLLLALVGTGRAVVAARRQPLGLLLLLNVGTLLVVRAMPNAPGHDGVRQFLVAFVFLAMLAGIGLQTLVTWALGRLGHRWPVVATLTLLVLAGAVQSVWIHPYELAYYSEAVGSLPGARRLGLETVYYWETLSPEVLAWMNQHPEPVAFATTTSVRGWAKLHEWGLLARHVTLLPLTASDLALIRSGQAPADWRPPPPTYYLQQMRQGAFQAWDWELVEQGVRPVYAVTRLGVPLLAVYRFQDLPEAGQEELRRRQAALVQQVRTGQFAGPKW